LDCKTTFEREIERKTGGVWPCALQLDLGDGHKHKSPISAQVVHQKFEFLKVDDPIASAPIKKLHFQPTCFGDKTTVQTEIFNNGPLPTEFDVRALVPTSTSPSSLRLWRLLQSECAPSIVLLCVSALSDIASLDSC
jgi:hypothetical protein